MSKYVDFGYGKELDQRITTDGELLATLITPDDLGKDEPDDLWERFIEAGGTEHSYGSFECVKGVASVLIRHGWKSIDDIPQDAPLFERIRNTRGEET